MLRPRTLLQLRQSDWGPATLPASALVLVGFQIEFRDGPLQLQNFGPAVEQAQELLERFREAGSCVVHLVRHGEPGQFFDRRAPRGRIAGEVAPAPGETIIEAPDAKALAAPLERLLKEKNILDVVFAGCSSHGSLSSAVRAAAGCGFRPTVVSAACASRNLPGPGGLTMPAEIMHLAAMAALADQYACVVDHAQDIATPIGSPKHEPRKK